MDDEIGPGAVFAAPVLLYGLDDDPLVAGVAILEEFEALPTRLRHCGSEIRRAVNK